jgi:hypothetical protein
MKRVWWKYENLEVPVFRIQSGGRLLENCPAGSDVLYFVPDQNDEKYLYLLLVVCEWGSKGRQCRMRYWSVTEIPGNRGVARDWEKEMGRIVVEVPGDGDIVVKDQG